MNSEDNISQEEIQRKLREKLELELASKEREIATLVIDTQKLQSTLIKVKETSVTQVDKFIYIEREEKKSHFTSLSFFFLFHLDSDI